MEVALKRHGFCLELNQTVDSDYVVRLSFYFQSLCISEALSVKYQLRGRQTLQAVLCGGSYRMVFWCHLLVDWSPGGHQVA